MTKQTHNTGGLPGYDPADGAASGEKAGRGLIPTSLRLESDLYDDMRLLAWYDRETITAVVNGALELRRKERAVDLRKMKEELGEEGVRKILARRT